jgi:Zn-dependent M28 family amino/carboxypeptidase
MRTNVASPRRVIARHTRAAFRGVAAALLAAAVGLPLPLPAAPASDPGARLRLPAPAARALNSIDAERIRAHVRFLADDLLEGRGTGTRGSEIAALYLATQFALDGLEPAGDDGSYLQRVNFKGVQTLPETTAILDLAQTSPVALKVGDDIVLVNEKQNALADVDAPVVFVGYGIDAPEFHWNDYRVVDVKGKVVLVIVNEPPSRDPKFFAGEALTYYGRWMYKLEEAARQGAVGALIIHRTDLASYGWNVVRSSWSNEQVYLADDRAPKLEAAAWIQLEIARQILRASNLDLDAMIDAAGKPGFEPRDLPVRFKAHIVSRVRAFASYNVLALLPGREPEPLGAQVVMYTAHYDHLGIDPNLTGDQIYNGAVDNGTGCGILLELARAWGTQGAHPPHPVLFASVTAEEKGLLGSRYLGQHMPVPAARVTLDLNFDAVPPIGMPQAVSVTGAERTTFYPEVEKTARAFGFAIEPDAEPGAGHYYRSDHFSLARVGVPAFSINTALKFAGHPAEWGKAQQDDYTAHRYHQPSDEYTPSMDFSSNAALARFGFALGWEASTAAHAIGWQAGDEFEAERLKSERTPAEP